MTKHFFFARIKCTLAIIGWFIVATASASEFPALSDSSSIFRNEWRMIRTSLDDGLPQTALGYADILYSKAVKFHDHANIAAAAGLRAHLKAQSSESPDSALIMLIEKELRVAATAPSKALLASYAASAYQLYYEKHRRQLRATTDIESDSVDFTAWGISRFKEKISNLFRQSLEPSEVLQRIPITEAHDVIQFPPFYPISKDSAAMFRPTLYDVLAYKALVYFISQKNTIAYADKSAAIENAFAPMNKFIQTFLDKKDNYIPSIYAALLRFHSLDATPEALLGAELERLKYARSIYGENSAGQPYKIALERIIKIYEANSAATYLFHALAEWHEERGDRARAVALCDSAINKFPRSRGTTFCRALKSRLTAPFLEITVEPNVIPNKSALLSISYAQISRLYFRIVKTSFSEAFHGNFMANERDDDDLILENRTGQIIREWSETTPLAPDFRQFVAQSALPPLPAGIYILFASTEPNFIPGDSGVVIATSFIASSISSFRQEISGYPEKSGWFIVDNETGKPLAGVSAEFFSRRFNYSARQSSIESIGKTIGDSLGFIPQSAVNIGQNDYSVILAASAGADTAISTTNASVWKSRTEDVRISSYLFTDRTIYRPGQTVQFKGIITTNNEAERKISVLANKTARVELRSPEGSRAAELRLIANEFGSYSGTFILPRNCMRGVWTISDENGRADFRVEEYKRPKFHVTLQQPEGAVALGSVITLVGAAETFAGSAVSNGKVKYKILKSVFFPAWTRGFLREPINDEIIADDTTSADNTGRFSISFLAAPNATADSADLPFFVFTITADVTDATGETRVATLDIRAGYRSAELNIDAPDQIKTDSRFTTTVIASNLNERPAIVSGMIALEKLSPNNRMRRKSALPVPDAILISPEEFAQKFPEDSPKIASELKNSDVLSQIILTKLPFTTYNGRDSVRFGPLASGVYRLSAAGNDPEGRKISIEKNFIAYDFSEDKKTAALPEIRPLIAFAEQATVMPGEVARFVIGSGYAAAKVLFVAEKDGKIIKREWLSISKELIAVEIPVTEEYRGGFSATVYLTHSGRSYEERIFIATPWTNKMLHIASSVIRDKVAPDAKEQWKLTVRGENSKIVAAEMLAAMYDASLDAISEAGDGASNKVSLEGKLFPWQNSAARLYLNETARINNFRQERGKFWGIQFYAPPLEYPELFIPFAFDNLYYTSMRKGVPRSRFAEDAQYAPMASAPSEAGILNAEANVREADVAFHTESPTVNSKYRGESEFDDAEQKNNRLITSPRTNLQETAFFFPQLRSDAEGEFSFSFVMPEALTTWRFLALAHTTDMQSGAFGFETITQKNLMALPNMPRFLREGDTITLPAAIVNLTDRSLDGEARLELFDAETMEPINNFFGLTNIRRQFHIEKSGNSVVSWRIAVPSGIDAIIWRVSASAGDFTDAEESILPILPDDIPVIETLPTTIRGAGMRTFTLDNLAELAKKPSPTLKNRKLVFEFIENPTWQAALALPTLMEYPYECAEQIFNRFAANAIATKILQSQPNIARAIRRWSESGSIASPLEKNESLKSIMLNETPWAVEGKSETERKQRVARLLDENATTAERSVALRKLRELQQPSGGFAWFAGMGENRVVTQYILAGAAHILALDAAETNREDLLNMAELAMHFADERAVLEHERLQNDKTFNSDEISRYDFYAAQYLYARSYFKDLPINKKAGLALAFYRNQAARFWQTQDLQTQALTALAFMQFSRDKSPTRENEADRAVAKKIIASLRERAARSDELGMHWTMQPGWRWQDAPIETQSLMIEAFELAGGYQSEVEDMRYWLLRNKQTHDWKTTKATAEACYALLLRGQEYSASKNYVEVRVGGKSVTPESRDAVDGYYSVSWSGQDITPDMATVTLKSRDKRASYGALYWQYSDKADRIKKQKSAISIVREMIVKKQRSGKADILSQQDSVALGSRLAIRLTIRSDREMEYIHVKDARASGCEPTEQTSGYEWRGNIGYYRSPSDGSVSFFLERLPRGTTIIEYDIFAAHEGSFAEGVATVQSLYAPEFAAHSDGRSIRVFK